MQLAESRVQPLGEPPAQSTSGFLPARVVIDAVGGGGFRFGDMGHRGGLLILPSGMHAWAAEDPATLVLADFAALLAEREGIDFLLLGTGAAHVMPATALVEGLLAAGVGLEAMTTRAACRTYNVVLAEGRAVAAALLPVA